MYIGDLTSSFLFYWEYMFFWPRKRADAAPPVCKEARLILKVIIALDIYSYFVITVVSGLAFPCACRGHQHRLVSCDARITDAKMIQNVCISMQFAMSIQMKLLKTGVVSLYESIHLNFR